MRWLRGGREEAFWEGWLQVMAGGVAAGGFLLALFPSSPPVEWLVSRPVLAAFDGGMSAVPLLYRDFLYGVLGACMGGWGLLMWFVVRGPFRRREPWAWRALAVPLLAWFVVDTAISAASGVGYNVLFNVALGAAFALPLLKLRRWFVPWPEPRPRVTGSELRA